MGSPIDWTHFQTWKQYVENPNGTGYRKNVYICREGSNWYDGSILKQDGLAIDRTCTATNYLEMGNVAAAALTLTIVAPPLDISSWAVGQELEIQVDIFERTDPSIPEDGGSGTAYMGIFIIDSITERNGAYTIEALDRMVLLDTPMDWSGLIPPDIPSVLNKISTVYGITIATDITTLPNYFWAFAEFPKLTARQVVSAIAEVMGSCAFMDWNGELRFAWYAPILNANSSTLELTSDIAFSRRTDPQSYDLDAYGIGEPDGTKVEVTGPDECKYNLVGNALVETNRAAGILVTGIADNIQIARYTDVQFQGEYHYFAGGEYEVLPFPYIWPMDVLDIDGVFVPINHVVYRLNANMTLTASADPRISDYSTAFTSSQQTVLDRMESATDAINKHFFYTNATGAHITTTENDPDTGNNVLIDSSGVYIREDTDVLAEFTATGSVFNENSDNRLRIVNSDTDGTTIISEGHGAYDPILYIAADDKTITSNVESGIIIEMQKGHFAVNELVRRSDLGPGRYAIGDEVFTCYKNNGNWAFRFAGNTDISDVAGIYLPGESVTITSDVPGYGYIPGSPAGRAYIYMDTFHKFPQGKTITVDALKLTIRGIGGIILNGADALGYSPTASVMGNGQIRFYLTGLPTTYMTYNTPLVCFGTFSVSIAQ